MVAQFDTRNIVSTHGTFHVTEQGVAHANHMFFIDAYDVFNVTAADFTSLYGWVVEADLDAALAAARTYHVSQENQNELAAQRERDADETTLRNAKASVDAYHGSGTLVVEFVNAGGDPIEGVDFTLDSAASDPQNGTSDEDGEDYFHNLTLGEDESEEYTITVTAVPEGVTMPVAPADASTITIIAGNIRTHTVTL